MKQVKIDLNIKNPIHPVIKKKTNLIWVYSGLAVLIITACIVLYAQITSK